MPDQPPVRLETLPALLSELAATFIEYDLRTHRQELVKQLGHNMLERHVIESHFNDALAQVRPRLEAFITVVLGPVLQSARAVAASAQGPPHSAV